MDIRQTVIELTKYTIPFGDEDKCLPFLPDNIHKDEFGNYFLEIGTGSDVMFTAHLDSYCTQYEQVNQVIDGNILKTDGTTILGADNKAGVALLLYLIHNNIPGLYYFFIGEEYIEDNDTGGGLYGSLKVAASKKWNKIINKVISFDRRDKGSIISHQLGMRTCSDEFCIELKNAMSDHNIISFIDDTGICTDSISFMYDISECTNISNGCYNEHTFDEYLDMEYFENLANCVIKIDWSNLPHKREIPKLNTGDTVITKFMEFTELTDMKIQSQNFFNEGNILYHTKSEELNIKKNKLKYINVKTKKIEYL